MSRLIPTGGLLTTTLFLAAGAWWLANVWLLARSGFVGLPIISTQAACALVLGQWLLIGLFAGQQGSATLARAAVSGLSFVVPLWPLFVMLWLSSELSATTVAATQVIALTLATVLARIGASVERLRIDSESRMLLRSAAGVLVAAAIWAGRSQLQAWVAV